MAKAAALFDPRMLDVHNLEYASHATVLFQRLSVCASSLVLVAAMLKATGAGSRGSPAQRLTAFVLVVGNAGLIMVDNIHFQYNSILMGAWAAVCWQVQCDSTSG
jgi:alpha-1,3-glucosyltransferase